MLGRPSIPSRRPAKLREARAVDFDRVFSRPLMPTPRRRVLIGASQQAGSQDRGDDLVFTRHLKSPCCGLDATNIGDADATGNRRVGSGAVGRIGRAASLRDRAGLCPSSAFRRARLRGAEAGSAGLRVFEGASLRMSSLSDVQSMNEENLQ
jgi:hypothetical protein